MDKWSRLSDLAAKLNTKAAEYKSVLVVRPALRPYIAESEAVYDYVVGHELVVFDQSSPLNNCRITICDADTLKKAYGLTHLSIVYNHGIPAVEVKL